MSDREKRPRISAVDTHAHVFRRDLAFAGQRRYTPDYDATLAGYLAMLDRTGSSHGVLIQPSFLGTNNGCLLGALESAPNRLRGVAVVAPTSSASDLAALDSQGIVGVRLNLIGEPDPALDDDVWRTHLRCVARLGWHVEVHAEAARLPTLLPPLLDAGVKVVVDHFGRPDPTLGVADPGFLFLCSLAAATHAIWVKLSGGYRLGPGTLGEGNAAAAAARLLQVFPPDRLLWGSDWPHTQFEDSADSTATRASLDVWVPDAKDRREILTAAPAKLFRFDA